MKRLIPILALTSLLLVALLFYFKKISSSQQEGSFTRKFESVNLEQIEIFNFDGNISSTQSYNGIVYIGDIRSNMIYKYLDSAFVPMYSENLRDSLSIQYIHEWEVDSSGLSIVDPTAKMIFTFSDGQFKDQYVLQWNVVRARKINSETFLLKIDNPENRFRKSKDWDEIFISYNLRTSNISIVHFPEPIVDHKDFTLDGFILIDNDFQFHICYRSSYFYMTDKYQESSYQSQTIDRSSVPQVITAGGFKKFAPNTKKVNFHAAVFGNYLFILSGVKSIHDSKGVGRIVDLYDKQNGKYVKSFRLPNYDGKYASNILCDDSDRLIVTYGNNVVTYAALSIN
jgi:hypothetical protein